MKNVFIAGGASFNSIIYLPDFPEPVPQTIHKCNYTETIGSTGSGKALNLSKLGFNVSFHAMLGDDRYGQNVISALKQENLKFTFDIDPQGTERHLNVLNEKGERISIFVNPGSEKPTLDYKKFKPLIQVVDYVVINLASFTKPLLFQAKELNKPIWVDLHDFDGKNPWYKEYIQESDYVFLSSDNLKEYKHFMEKMINSGKELVVVTHGKKGSTALTKSGDWIEVPTLENMELIDCNGAGDAYFSGFIYGHSQGFDTKTSMEFASICGALAINSSEIFNQKLSQKYLTEIHKLNY